MSEKLVTHCEPIRSTELRQIPGNTSRNVGVDEHGCMWVRVDQTHSWKLAE